MSHGPEVRGRFRSPGQYDGRSVRMPADRVAIVDKGRIIAMGTPRSNPTVSSSGVDQLTVGSSV